MGVEPRREKLRTEHEELAREHREEKMAAEQLQVRLSNEMRELRDQCQQQGHTVGLLAKRLDDARSAVLSELRSAAAVRTALADELEDEESQRQALEVARRGEEAEIAGRVEQAEQQLSTMSGVRASLESQLKASARVQAELRDHIAAERGGRAELELAGERELVAWSEHNEKVSGDLRNKLHSERAEADNWRATASQQVGQLREECTQNSKEESRLVEKLRSVREKQSATRGKLRSEVVAWHHEADVLRAQIQEANEEHWKSEDALRRHRAAQGACGCERELLEEELEERMEQAQTNSEEFEHLERLSEEMQEELQELRDCVQSYRTDREAERLRSERETLVREVEAEKLRQVELRDEIEADRKSWGFLCMRRRQVPSSPPASPHAAQRSPSVPRGPPPAPPPRSSVGSTASTGSSAEFQPGAIVRTVDSAQMRRGEELQSEKLLELHKGCICEILEQGQGRRIKVRDVETGDSGWISSSTRNGVRLVEMVSQELAARASASSAASVSAFESDQV